MTATIDQIDCPQCGAIAMYSQDNTSGDTHTFCPTCKFSYVNGVEKGFMIDAIEILTGIIPDEIEENCGSIHFRAKDKWYFITYEECEEEEDDEE